MNVQNYNQRLVKKKLMSEINMTPMVDVMLVLLVIFMIASPMLIAGIELDLPKTQAKIVANQTKPLIISINKKAQIFIFNTKIKPENFISKLKNITKNKKDSRIFVRGDKNIAYGKIVKLMAKIQNAGFSKVALISDVGDQ